MNATEGIDALRFYHTGAATFGAAQANPATSLGGKLSSTEVIPLRAVVGQGGIRGLSIDWASGSLRAGLHLIEALPDERLRLAVQGARLGESIAVARGASALLLSGDGSHAVRVSRSATSPMLRGRASLLTEYAVGNVVSMGILELQTAGAGLNRYRCIGFKNVGSRRIEDLRFWIKPIGPKVLRTGAPSGADIVAYVTDDLSDWPGGNLAEPGGHVVVNASRNNGDGTPDTAYYSEVVWTGPTPAGLNLPLNLRAYLNSGAVADWMVGDSIYALPPVAMNSQQPTSQPVGDFGTAATETSTPSGGGAYSGVSCSPIGEYSSQVVRVAGLEPGHIGALWLRQRWLKDVIQPRPYNLVKIGYSFRI